MGFGWRHKLYTPLIPLCRTEFFFLSVYVNVANFSVGLIYFSVFFSSTFQLDHTINTTLYHLCVTAPGKCTPQMKNTFCTPIDDDCCLVTHLFMPTKKRWKIYTLYIRCTICRSFSNPKLNRWSHTQYYYSLAWGTFYTQFCICQVKKKKKTENSLNLICLFLIFFCRFCNLLNFIWIFADRC